MGLAVALSALGCGEDDAGKVVTGTGYEVTVPDGWRDRSEEGEDVEVQGFSPDIVLIGERDDGFTTNLNVIRTPGVTRELDAQTRLERRLIERGGAPGAAELRPAQNLTPVERTELGGEDARAYEFEIRDGERRIRVRQLLAIREEVAYFATLTTAPGRFDEDRDDFESILESWTWR